MTIEPIGIFHSPLGDKFGLPRQSGLVEDLRGSIVLEERFRSPDAFRGLEGFDYIWLIWSFNRVEEEPRNLTVRPPRLGGNERVGVFASRSPFRPNRLGLSCVKLESFDPSKGVIRVAGADLADGTPVYDIKPYVEYADSRPGARCGFVGQNEWSPLEVQIPENVESLFSPNDLKALKGILAQDPRPAFQNDPERIYGLMFSGKDIRFKVAGNLLTVLA